MEMRTLIEDQRPLMGKFHLIEVAHGLAPDISVPLPDLLHRDHQFMVRLYVYRMLEELMEAEFAAGDERLVEVADVLTFALDLAILLDIRELDTSPYLLSQSFEEGALRIRWLSHLTLQQLQNKAYRVVLKQKESHSVQIHGYLRAILSTITKGLGYDEEEVNAAFYAKRIVNRQRVSEPRSD